MKKNQFLFLVIVLTVLLFGDLAIMISAQSPPSPSILPTYSGQTPTFDSDRWETTDNPLGNLYPWNPVASTNLLTHVSGKGYAVSGYMRPYYGGTSELWIRVTNNVNMGLGSSHTLSFYYKMPADVPNSRYEIWRNYERLASLPVAYNWTLFTINEPAYFGSFVTLYFRVIQGAQIFNILTPYMLLDAVGYNANGASPPTPKNTDLTISPSANGVVRVAWNTTVYPTNSYSLWVNTNLGVPLGWVRATNHVTVTGTNATITLPIQGVQGKFLRFGPK